MSGEEKTYIERRIQMTEMYNGYRIETKKIYEVFRGEKRIASGELEPPDKADTIIEEVKKWLDKKKDNVIS